MAKFSEELLKRFQSRHRIYFRYGSVIVKKVESFNCKGCFFEKKDGSCNMMAEFAVENDLEPCHYMFCKFVKASPSESFKYEFKEIQEKLGINTKIR